MGMAREKRARIAKKSVIMRRKNVCRPPLHLKKEAASMSNEESDSTLELDGS